MRSIKNIIKSRGCVYTQELPGADPDIGERGSSHSHIFPDLKNSRLTLFQDIRRIILCYNIFQKRQEIIVFINPNKIILSYISAGNGVSRHWLQTFFGGSYSQIVLSFGWGKG